MTKTYSHLDIVLFSLKIEKSIKQPSAKVRRFLMFWNVKIFKFEVDRKIMSENMVLQTIQDKLFSKI